MSENISGKGIVQRRTNTNPSIVSIHTTQFVLMVALLVLTGCTHNKTIRPSAPQTSDRTQQQPTHCPFGKPIARKNTNIGLTEFVWHEGYDLLHSADHKTPYWVCESNTSRTLEHHTSRKGMRFTVDPQLHLAHAEPSDYRGSSRLSIDIGHMAPAGDHESSQQDLRDTFYLSNAVPQNAALNRGLWEHIEACARQTTSPNSTTWIITGPVNTATDAPDTAQSIGAGVTIPARLWKIVINENANGEIQAWAVDVPNAQPPADVVVGDFAVSIATIESETGFDLLPSLSIAQQQSLKRTARSSGCN